MHKSAVNDAIVVFAPGLTVLEVSFDTPCSGWSLILSTIFRVGAAAVTYAHDLLPSGWCMCNSYFTRHLEPVVILGDLASTLLSHFAVIWKASVVGGLCTQQATRDDVLDALDVLDSDSRLRGQFQAEEEEKAEGRQNDSSTTGGVDLVSFIRLMRHRPTSVTGEYLVYEPRGKIQVKDQFSITSQRYQQSRSQVFGDLSMTRNLQFAACYQSCYGSHGRNRSRTDVLRSDMWSLSFCLAVTISYVCVSHGGDFLRDRERKKWR